MTPNRGEFSSASRAKSRFRRAAFSAAAPSGRAVIVAADDADQNDWIEIWGTRIGRALGLLSLIAAFLVWLADLARLPEPDALGQTSIRPGR